MRVERHSETGRWRAGRYAALALSGAVLLYAVIEGAPKQAAMAAQEAAAPADIPGLRRLNEDQYIRSIHQIFGDDIRVPGRFDPPLRDQGLLAIGDTKVTVTPSGIEQYELRAREIAAQVLDESHRKTSVSCTPATADAFDQACATRFFASYGRLLYRRPLSGQEMDALLRIGRTGAETNKDFYSGLQLGLMRMLVSPKFLFRVETGSGGSDQLDDYALATRLSFFLWDLPPDAELLDAASRGELRTEQGLAAQVDRMIGSPRFEQGARSFFADMFGYENFLGLAKDQAIYPKFNAELARDAREQTLRTVVDLLVTNKGDYRDLFTTRKTFLNRNLGALYRVPVSGAGMNGWQPYTFAPGEHREGILTLAGFLMLDATHEGRSSPTIRGKTVRESLLCQPVPQPPPNVNFALVQDVHNPQFRTARQRLSKHQENPACAGCHALTDPIGLGMENYDAVGAWRTEENGAPIDATGTFEGKDYNGLQQLSRLLHDSPTVTSCVVQRAYEYGVGRPAGDDDGKWMETADKGFARDGYRFPALMRQLALSDRFRSVSAAPRAGSSSAGAGR